jgi:hypothetical protein
MPAPLEPSKEGFVRLITVLWLHKESGKKSRSATRIILKSKNIAVTVLIKGVFHTLAGTNMCSPFPGYCFKTR